MKNIPLLILLWTGALLHGQELSAILDSQLPTKKEYVDAIFKGTRILNGHSVENRKKGTLEFLIMHRFGRVNLGAQELWGLDQSNIRFAFEYSIIDDIMVGIGRSSFDKTFDGFVKYKFLKQRKEKGAFPFSASLFGATAYKTLKDFDPSTPRTDKQKLSYVSQLLIASKISPSFSLQCSPTYIHNNSVRATEDPHGIFAMGLGSRIKLTKRTSINAEYFYQFDRLQSVDTMNVISLGIDIETGGHVFQIILSNSITMIEKSFITETTGNFFEGDIHLGFNISRAFQTGNHRKRKH